MDEVKPGIYRHFKGGDVRVLHMATHSETLERLVVYITLYECRSGGKGTIWVRPLSMFTEMVEHEGKTVLRFEPRS